MGEGVDINHPLFTAYDLMSVWPAPVTKKACMAIRDVRRGLQRHDFLAVAEGPRTRNHTTTQKMERIA